MSALIVIPVRGTQPSKTRLASLFSSEERLRLVRAMLSHMLDQLPTGIDAAVITRSPDALIGLPAHIRVIEQQADFPGLNGSLQQALFFARDHNYRDFIMLPGDLPMLQTHEIESLWLEDGGIVIAGDRDQEGTNGIRMPTSLAERFHFGMGEHSFGLHLAEARRLGIVPVTVYYQGLAHDLDSPDDWMELPETVRERLTLSLQLAAKGA